MEKIEIEGKRIRMALFQVGDKEKLFDYLNSLSEDSKKRYGPHPFTLAAILEKFKDAENYKMFVAHNEQAIIAYIIVKMGWVDFDNDRLRSYGLQPTYFDATIAPSVADSWQGKGIGSRFFDFVINYLRTKHTIKRIILWGGVQSDNEKAVRLYQKFNFNVLGEFQHNGMNTDMILDLS